MSDFEATFPYQIFSCEYSFDRAQSCPLIQSICIAGTCSRLKTASHEQDIEMNHQMAIKCENFYDFQINSQKWLNETEF